MGLFKSSQPEDIDITDPRDVGDNQPLSISLDRPTAVDWAITEIYGATRTLMDNKHLVTVGDMQEIKQVIEHLNYVIDKIEKPF